VGNKLFLDEGPVVRVPSDFFFGGFPGVTPLTTRCRFPLFLINQLKYNSIEIVLDLKL
jgi:hypothetical protein